MYFLSITDTSADEPMTTYITLFKLVIGGNVKKRDKIIELLNY